MAKERYSECQAGCQIFKQVLTLLYSEFLMQLKSELFSSGLYLCLYVFACFWKSWKERDWFYWQKPRGKWSGNNYKWKIFARTSQSLSRTLYFLNLQALEDLHHRHRKTSIMIQWKEFIKHPLRFTIYHSIHLRFRNFNQRELKYFTNQPQGLQVWFLIFIWTIYCYF